MADDPLRNPGEPRLKLPGGLSTRQSIEAEQRVAERARRRTAIPIPTIRGPAAWRLTLAEDRHVLNDDELQFRDEGPEVLLRSGAERGAVALACVLLENIQRRGGTHAPSRALREVTDRLLISLSQSEVMAVEVEAYELMQWLGGALNPYFDPVADPRPPEMVKEDPATPVLRVLRQAIADGFDVDMMYYTGGRGELTERRVTPIKISAETYLTAFCHHRRAERVFRLSRIGEARRAQE